MRTAVFLRLCLLLALSTFTVEVKGDLSAKQARRLITRMAGIEVPNSAVRVKKIAQTSPSTAEATAEIHTIFRLATNAQGFWRVAELRLGQDRWEQVGPLGGLHAEALSSECDGPHVRRGAPLAEPSAKRARCLIAAVLGVELPSDAVRIKNVSPLELPLASHPSAVVESLITAELRFERDKRGWVVAELRTGNREWVRPEIVVASGNETKIMKAREEMDAMARALARFRTERHSYVVSDSHAVLIDYLSPRFLSRVIRLDPWQEPYRYRGDRDNFTLRSLGSDRKENTADDIVINGPAQ